MALISQTEFDRLCDVARMQNLCDNSYLRDKRNQNFKWICQQYFYGNTEDTKLFNVGSGIFGTVQSVFKAFVGNPNIGHDIYIGEMVADYIATGYFAVTLYRKDNKLAFRREPAENVSYDNGVYRVIKIYVKDAPSANGKAVASGVGPKNTYILVQEYGVGYIESKLYKVLGYYNLAMLVETNEVPLTSIFETEEIPPYELTGLEVPAIFIVKNSDTTELVNLVSMVKEIENMVYSIDRKICMFDTQFLNNLESFILLKNIVLPKKLMENYNNGKKLNFNQLGRVITANDDGDIKFISNKNELIDNAIAYEDKQIRRIASKTTIPTDFFGLGDSNGGIGVGSRTTLHGAFIKTVETIRDIIVKGLTPVLELVAKENGEEINTTAIVWGDVFAKSSTEVIDELKTARDARLISQKRAVMQYLGLDEKQALKEIEQINSEEYEKEVDVGGDGSDEDNMDDKNNMIPPKKVKQTNTK